MTRMTQAEMTQAERIAASIAVAAISCLLAAAFVFGLGAAIDHELDAHSAAAFPEYADN